MAIIRSGNFSFRDPTDVVKDGDTVAGGNFTQVAAGTEILQGLHVTITGGNWCNVQPQATWRIEGGSWAEHEFCSHENPQLVERGFLDPEPDDCPHRSTERSWVPSDVDEFKTLKDSAQTEADARIVSNKDAYGLPAKGDAAPQKFAYTYRGRVLRSGAAVLAQS